MKVYFTFLISTIFFHFAGTSFAQRFPEMMEMSADGKRLVTGNKPATGFYEPLMIHDIHLNFSDPDFWTQLEDNYYSRDDIMATMMINGVVYDSVGVRFKGHSSYTRIGNSLKKSFNISLNEYIEGQDINGYNTLNLNNCYNDPSFFAEVMYEGQARKHNPAPKGNFAHLVINGQDWGIYANVQQVNRDLVKEWFPSDQGSLLRAKRPIGSPGVSDTVGKASMNNLGNDPVEYSWYYTENHSTINDVYEKLMEACITLDTVSSSSMQSTLGEMLDIDRALWFMATEIAFADMDGYCHKGKNDYYLFYEDETNRFHPIEMDGNDVLETIEVGQMSPFYNSTNINFPLLSKILAVPGLRQRYLAHMRTIIDEELDTAMLFPIMDTYKTLLDPFISQNILKLYTYPDFINKVQTHKNNILTRRALLLSDAEVNRIPPAISDVTRLVGQTPIIRPASNQDVTVRATVNSSSGIYRVYLYYATGLTGQFAKTRMYDDGAHQDLASGDGIFGATLNGEDGGTWVRFYIEAIADNSQKTVSYDPPGAEHDIYAFLVQPSKASDTSVVINEIMAINSATVTDSSGAYEDWVELYNNSNQTKDLSGYYLTDNPLNLKKWGFPSGTTIPAQGYQIIWADDNPDKGTFHTNFKFSGNGEQVYLVNEDLELVDSVSFGPQSPDISLARVLNGTGNFITQPATFGYNNNPIPLSNFSALVTTGCLPFTVQFQNYSLHGTTFLWDFGDGFTSTNFSPQHTYTDTGSYDVTLISNFANFSDTLTITGLINAFFPLSFRFSVDTIHSPALTYLLDAGTGYSSYLWSTGATSSSIIVNNTGNYCLTVADQHSCTDSDCIYIILNSTGIEKVRVQPVFLFPNPADEEFRISTNENKLSSVEIYNPLGKLIFKDFFMTSIQIKSHTWPEGIYFLKIENELKKLLIQR